jgi:hypothetical protein
MDDDRPERNRVLGVPVGPAGPGRRAVHGEEQQRVMGFPADWIDSVDLSPLRSLAHPVRGYRRWMRRRRLGPYATDEENPRNLWLPVLLVLARVGVGVTHAAGRE